VENIRIGITAVNPAPLVVKDWIRCLWQSERSHR